MKALSLTQPWASLVAIGAKKIETRSWGTAYRGPLAIHAARKFPADCKDLCMGSPFMDALIRGGFESTEDLPLGAVVAIANLHRVGRISWSDDGDAMVKGLDLPIEGDELEFGDYTAGRYGWVLTNVVRLETPIPVRGSLGLWEWAAPEAVLSRPGYEWWRDGGRLAPR
jgi:hypothetical protein